MGFGKVFHRERGGQGTLGRAHLAGHSSYDHFGAVLGEEGLPEIEPRDLSTLGKLCA